MTEQELDKEMEQLYALIDALAKAVPVETPSIMIVMAALTLVVYACKSGAMSKMDAQMLFVRLFDKTGPV